MSKGNLVRAARFPRIVGAVIAILVFAADQVSKTVIQRVIPEHTTIPVLPHFFNLIHTHNAGAAFGLFSDSPAPWKTGLLIIISSALLAMVIAVLWRNPQFRWEMGVGLALILGGAFSNLFDRIRSGQVVDFFDFYYRSYHWPTFNFADSAIVVGAGFVVFQLLFLE